MNFLQIFNKILAPAILETLYMTFVSTIIATLIGTVMAVILYYYSKQGLKPIKSLYSVLDTIVNILRSFPFMILIIVIFPFTKLIVGTSIGTTATIVPLIIGTAPFITRLIESAMKEVDKGVIEAAKSFGSSNFQILFRVILVEALPGIINAVTLTLIVVVGFTAMAGAIGGGGLGDVAIKYGFQRFRGDIMLYTVVVLIIIVQIIQIIGNFLYKISKK